jgi:D-3-phosphoglycerate dehydrogenase
MYNIQTLNKIAACGTDLFDKGRFNVTAIDGTDQITNPEAVLIRSADMHPVEFNPELLAIGRAGAGTNNVPVDKCAEKGIVVFNTPGANANGVKELTIAGLLLASRKVTAAIDEAKTLKGKGAEVPKLVEKIKGAFGGIEIKGKTLGVIGLGAIGKLVAEAAAALGMEIIGFDPFAGDVAGVKMVKSLDEVYKASDYISLNLPVTAETKGMISTAQIALMKDKVRIVNFARAELVDDTALIDALGKGKVACYVTDFPTDAVIGVDGVVAIPHLGASTAESEDNCAIMAANQVIDFIENGNIVNSVNFPALTLAKSGDKRVCVTHKASVGADAIASAAGNVTGKDSKAKGDYAYTIVDVSGSVDEAKVKAIDGVIKVRVI